MYGSSDITPSGMLLNAFAVPVHWFNYHLNSDRVAGVTNIPMEGEALGSFS